MYRDRIREILDRVRSSDLDVDAALERLTHLPYEDVGFANLDHHRALRKGVPEVVFCENKTPDQVAEIVLRLSEHHDVLATRASADAFAAAREQLPDARYNEIARCITWRHPGGSELPVSEKSILVLSAGTSDMAVAEEAVVTAEMLRSRVERLYDVGVAGIHRLLDRKDAIEAANVLVVVAGMDGVLPAVVGGLVGKPVIAVPTSVGYGAAFQGLAPLLTMLNSCSPGVAVVNIDNGFGAGYFASLINR